jgi:hypothetical protein
MPIAPLKPAYAPLAKAEPFASVEEAWFWTITALLARRDGARITAGKGLTIRPCEPDDVVKCLDRLYRQRRIELAHARVLRSYGERGQPPSPRHLSERRDHALWREALSRLEGPLRAKGIIGDGVFASAQIIPFPGPRA